jgi:hypothetical protein
VVLDSADTINNADDASFIDLEYFLPDVPLVDVVITTRSSRAQEMTTLEAGRGGGNRGVEGGGTRSSVTRQ